MLLVLADANTHLQFHWVAPRSSWPPRCPESECRYSVYSVPYGLPTTSRGGTKPKRSLGALRYCATGLGALVTAHWTGGMESALRPRLFGVFSVKFPPLRLQFPFLFRVSSLFKAALFPPTARRSARCRPCCRGYRNNLSSITQLLRTSFTLRRRSVRLRPSSRVPSPSWPSPSLFPAPSAQRPKPKAETTDTPARPLCSPPVCVFASTVLFPLTAHQRFPSLYSRLATPQQRVRVCTRARASIRWFRW